MKGNGWLRSKVRQHRLRQKYANRTHRIWASGVYFDEDKRRLCWFNNLWNRKYWRGVANRRLRHKKNVPNYGAYRKFFYMILNCDRW